MAGQGGAIKAGRAFVELFVDDNKIYRGLDNVAGKFKGWGGQMWSLGATLGAGGGGILAPLVAGLTEVTQRAAGLKLLADNLGETVAATSTLAGGFERVGVSADSFGGILEGLRTRVAEAADANGYLLENLRSLGPAARLAGLPTRELLNQLADSIQRIPNAVNQLRAAKGLGLEGILPQLRKGREGIDELFAGGGPGAVTEEEGRQALELTRATTAAWKDFKDTVRQVFMALLPTASELSNLSVKFKAGLGEVREWIKANKGAVVAVAAVGVGLVAAGALVVGLGTTVFAVGAGISLTLAAIKLSLGLLFSPIGLIVAGFAALVAYTDVGQRSIASLKDGLAGLAQSARETFGAISQAAGAGDWALAWQIGLAAIKAAWAEFALAFQLSWNRVKSFFVDTWRDVVAGLKLMFIDFGSFIAKMTVGVLRKMLDGIAGAVGKVSKSLGDKLKSAVASIPSMERIEQLAESDRQRVINERVADQRASDAHRSAAAAAATESRNAARDELGRLRELARWRAEFEAMPWLTDDEDDGAGQGGPAANFSGPARLADVVKGGFNGAVANQQFGIGDTIPAQQLDATRGVMANTAQIPQMARDLNTVARGGRLGP